MADSPEAVRLSADILAWQGLFALKMGKEQLAQDLLREGLSALAQLGVVTAISGTASCALLQMGLALSRAQSAERPAAFLLADIDNFRLVNDTFGHSTGDRVLEDFWELWWQSLSEDGVAFRWGGEELVMLLPGVDGDSAIVYAEGIRQSMRDHVCQSVDGREVRVTISIGVAVYPQDADDLIALHACADQAAIRAKAAGKNRVCVSADVP
jgi:diguanylate cyclase (GGDEF)-like protein